MLLLCALPVWIIFLNVIVKNTLFNYWITIHGTLHLKFSWFIPNINVCNEPPVVSVKFSFQSQCLFDNENFDENVTGWTDVWMSVNISGLNSLVVRVLSRYARGPGYESRFRLNFLPPVKKICFTTSACPPLFIHVLVFVKINW